MEEGQQLGRLLLIQIGNGADPEQFLNLCGLTARTFSMSTNEVDTTIPNCLNPGDVVQKTSRAGIASRNFSGSGAYVAGSDNTAFVNHVINATAFNAKVIVPSLGSFTGSWFATDYSLDGDVEPNMQFSVTFVAAGVLTFLPEV